MSIIAHSKSLQFEVKTFPTGRSGAEEISQGLRQLYHENISESELNTQIQSSQNFQDQIYQTLEKQIATNKMMEATAVERILPGNFVKETTIRFKSLIQHDGQHASNQVVARIYEPSVSRAFCEHKYPTTIFLHHILNQLGMIEDLAKVMASGVAHQPAIIVVLHMPHYGERKNGNEEFLNSDLSAFRKNMAQLILDTHLLRNFLETRSNVNTEKLSLSGISLGAVMGITVGAFDQGFSSYGNLVGGVDMSNILINRATTRKDSEVAIALKDIKLDEPSIRHELASVDSMTWLHRYKNKKLFFLNASRDDIINYDNSVKPMLDHLKNQQNDVLAKLNDDTHSPTGSIFKKIKEVFFPLLDFVVDNSPTYDKSCPRNNN